MCLQNNGSLKKLDGFGQIAILKLFEIKIVLVVNFLKASVFEIVKYESWNWKKKLIFTNLESYLWFSIQNFKVSKFQINYILFFTFFFISSSNSNLQFLTRKVRGLLNKFKIADTGAKWRIDVFQLNFEVNFIFLRKCWAKF